MRHFMRQIISLPATLRAAVAARRSFDSSVARIEKAMPECAENARTVRRHFAELAGRPVGNGAARA